MRSSENERSLRHIMAMKRAGLDAETIGKVSDAMTDCFDDTTVAEAGRYYVKGAVR